MSETSASYNRILKSTSVIGGASFLNLAIGVVRTKVLAIMLGPIGVGLASLYTGFLNTASTVATLGLGPVGTRQVASAFGKSGRELAVVRKSLFWATALLSVIGGVALWLMRSILAAHVLGDSSYAGAIGWIAAGVALTVIATTQMALIQGMRRIGDIARLNILGSLGSTVLCTVLLWKLGRSGLIAYVVLVPAVNAVLGYVYVAKLPKVEAVAVGLREMSSEWRLLFRFGIAMVAAGLVGTVAQLWVRIDIARSLGSESLGHYQAAWTVSMQYLTFILTAMGTDYYPRLTAVMREPRVAERLVNEQTEIAMLLSTPVFIAMISTAPLILRLLYSASFAPAVEVLRWQVLGDVLKVASWPMAFIILAAGDGRTFFLTEAASWVVLTGLIRGLVPLLGLRMTGIAYLLMYMFYLPLVYWIARRRVGFRWSPAVVRLVAASVASCVAAGAVVQLWAWGWVAGCIAAALSALFSAGRIAKMADLGRHLTLAGAASRRLILLAEGLDGRIRGFLGMEPAMGAAQGPSESEAAGAMPGEGRGHGD